MTTKDEEILDRIEARVDVAILVSQGVSREEAEQRVYLPRMHALLVELKQILKER